MFLADVELRLQQQGNSLDEVLIKLQNCCIPSAEYWQTDDFMHKLDELSQTTVFTDLLKNEASQPKFPVDKKFERTFSPIRNESLENLLTPIEGLQSRYYTNPR